jgi:hypothetical protein
MRSFKVCFSLLFFLFSIGRAFAQEQHDSKIKASNETIIVPFDAGNVILEKMKGILIKEGLKIIIDKTNRVEKLEQNELIKKVKKFSGAKYSFVMAEKPKGYGKVQDYYLISFTVNETGLGVGFVDAGNDDEVLRLFKDHLEVFLNPSMELD